MRARSAATVASRSLSSCEVSSATCRSVFRAKTVPPIAAPIPTSASGVSSHHANGPDCVRHTHAAKAASAIPRPTRKKATCFSPRK
ncbi:MAG: hypothetical protein M5U28_02330 [Sandaracinaceae bacterium]|nr:hypothetical protein [Sandaracinaceae bacterium]